jgi:phospho-N-acetylmuramoyl-pentapeptide-transferase
MYLPEAAIDVIKIFTLGGISFIIAFLSTPILIRFLYKHKLWRKEARDKAIDGGEVSFFRQFHQEGETNIPRMGGLLIWGTVIFVIFVFWGISKITDIWWLDKLNFLSRSQTWLPLFALVTASLLGLTDDVLQVFGKGKYIGGGLSLKKRLFLVASIGLIGALWFYFKLDWTSINIPGYGSLEINGWYIPIFVIVMMAVYSGGVIDGLDGLAAGSFISIFTAFAGIALFIGQIDLAAFCTVILGALLAFLWFNIPPAKFYMGENGMIGLCATLTVIAFLTDSVLVLPIIAFLLVIESGSVIIQLLSKKIRGKKVFLAAPIHHHFEAKGWPDYSVTMRFWIIGIVMALFGITIRLLG